MIARIVYFGIDDCHRIAVLRSAGCSVDECGGSIALLHAALTGPRQVDAVVIGETDAVEPHEAISLTRATSVVPLVLLESVKPHYDVSKFDLIVPCLTDPEKRLSDIGTIIEQRNAIQAKYRSLRESSGPVSVEG